MRSSPFIRSNFHIFYSVLKEVAQHRPDKTFYLDKTVPFQPAREHGGPKSGTPLPLQSPLVRNKKNLSPREPTRWPKCA